MKRLILDLDETISSNVGGSYAESVPHDGMLKRIQAYKAMGFAIVINTSRNMRTYEGNIGKINANTLPIIIEWLDRHGIPMTKFMWASRGAVTKAFTLMTRLSGPMSSSR